MEDVGEYIFNDNKHVRRAVFFKKFKKEKKKKKKKRRTPFPGNYLFNQVYSFPLFFSLEILFIYYLSSGGGGKR